MWAGLEQGELVSLLATLASYLGAGGEARLSPLVARARNTVPELQTTLRENILWFWLPRTLDRRYGGYVINFGPRGEPNGKTSKGIVTQSRHVWLFSCAAREGYGGGELIDAAEHGYRFLCDRLWDAKHGGVWQVSADGKKVIRGKKHLVGQWYSVYAIAEFARATGRKDALGFATEIFHLVDAHSHDAEFGGYLEAFERDWSPSPPRQPHYMGVPPTVKLLNTHMHVLEALATLYRANRLAIVRERLLEMITIESNAVIRKGIGVCTQFFDRQWRPCDLPGTCVGYGHDLENISLVSDACDAAQSSVYPLVDMFRFAFQQCLRYGWDDRHGGFYDSGPPSKPASRKDKIWWVQAEALWSALVMYRLTREPIYLGVFLRTWEFTRRKQIDWNNGEWWERVTPSGRQRGDKAHIWKAGYHQGRAMMECIKILRALS